MRKGKPLAALALTVGILGGAALWHKSVEGGAPFGFIGLVLFILALIKISDANVARRDKTLDYRRRQSEAQERMARMSSK